VLVERVILTLNTLSLLVVAGVRVVTAAVVVLVVIALTH
jgi:hypothetical protein